ncbi:MAG: PorV/PorQ family protein [Candidatus Neomarinimicrobiota bacterium]
MNKYIVSIICILLAVNLLVGQDADQKVGMTGAKFLAIPVGARAAGMGEAFTGIVDDGSAIFWNVAGIAKLDGHGLFVSNTQWPADIQFEAAAITIDVARMGKLSFNIVAMHMGQMRVRTAYQPDGTGEMFTVQSFAGGLGWAKGLTDQFAMGLNLKYIREEFAGLVAAGWAIDVGSLYDTGWNGMKIGMSMTNFGSDIAFDGTFRKWYDLETPGVLTRFDEYALPLTFRFGITMDVLEMGSSKIVLAADAIHPPDNKELVNLGFEMRMAQMVALRAGYKIGVDEGGLTAGVGLNLPFMGTAIDMAYSAFGELGNVTRISLGMNF